MIFEMPGCGGCKTCMLACSYHHRSIFNPSISSLIVHENTKEKGYFIELVEKDTGLRVKCDGCKDLKVPLCIEYCEKEQEFKEILNEFLRTLNGHSVPKDKQ